MPNPEYTLNSFLLTATVRNKINNQVQLEPENVVDNAPVNAPVKLNSTQNKILQLIEKGEQINISEITETLGKDRRTITRNIKALKDAGIIIRVGSDRKGYWKIIK